MLNNNLKWVYLPTIYFIISLALIHFPVINAQQGTQTATTPATIPTTQAELNDLLDPLVYVGLLVNKTIPGTKVNVCVY